MIFDIQSVIDPPDCSLQIAGELDLATADSLRDAIHFQLQRGNHTLTVDLSGVSFMDSSGMHALAWALTETQRYGGTLTITLVSAPVTRIMRIMGAQDLLSGPK